MSIAGVGIDVVLVPRFAEQLRVDGTVMQEMFTPGERELVAPGRDLDEHLAARWAAKEAFVKAWSVTRHGAAPMLGTLDLREIEIVRDAWGRPTLRLHGEVAAAVSASVDDCRFHVSLSHDGDAAVAMVLIESDSHIDRASR